MAVSPFKKIAFYYRTDVPKTQDWDNRIRRWIKTRYPKTKILPTNTIPRKRSYAPDLLIVLGGDGTMCEAAQKYQHWNPLIVGLNLGHVGFLASVRAQKDFLKGLGAIFRKKHRTIPRMLIQAALVRKGKKFFSTFALNEVGIQNLWGMVTVSVHIDGHPVQVIRGNGVLVATATGSTAYNLSAHGPIVMPDIKCFVITELLDHSLPTPSLIIKRNRTIELVVENFRKKDEFIIRKTAETADVIMWADIEKMVALQKGDRIIIRKSERLVRFAELDKNYFFKSLQEKFSFR